MQSRSHRNISKITLTLLMAVAMVGCSDSPTDPGPGGGTRSDYPEIPEPNALGTSVPLFSSEVVHVEPLVGIFYPRVLDAYGTWDGQKVCGGTRQYLTTVNGWASDLAVDSGNDYQTIAASLQGQRVTLLDDSGDAEFPVFRFETPSVCFNPIGVTTADLVYRGGQLEEPVYLRRTRQWWSLEVGNSAKLYQLINPGDSDDVEASYPAGSGIVGIEGVGQSLAGATVLNTTELQILLSDRLSNAFSATVTVESPGTSVFSETVTGKPGKVLQASVWVLVENYTFSDEEGNPLSRDRYILGEDGLHVAAAEVMLQVTEFDEPK